MMKIKTILLISLLAVLLFLTGCSNKENTTTEQKSTDSTTTDVVDNTPIDEGNDTEQELLNPVMEWFELYNPNGFDTVTCLITNPNDVAIDVSYNLVFYKNGTEVSRIEYCDNFSISPKGQDIIWANVEVPSANDADEVRMEDVYVSEAYDSPIAGIYEYVGVIDGRDFYNFTFDEQPTLATIWFVLYNDNNGNGKFDKGEIVTVDFEYLTEKEGQVSYDLNVNYFTNTDVYFNAY